MNDSPENLTQSLKKMMQTAGIASWQMLSDRAGVSRRAIDSLRKGNGANLKYADLAKLATVLQTNITDFMAEFVDKFTGEFTDKFTGEFTNNLYEQTEHSHQVINDRITHDVTVDCFDDLPPEMGNDLVEQKQNQKQNQGQNQGQNLDLQAEYQLLLDRLEPQIEQQKQDLRSQLIREALQQLESLLLQLPSAIYAVQQNPQLPAKNILPLLRPLDALLQQWEITAIGVVGEQIAYDPQEHELMDQAMAQDQAVGDRVLVRYVGYKFGDRLLHRARVSGL